MRFNILWTLIWLALSPSLSGCASNMAMLRHQTHYYMDASILERGADRERVTARLGPPIASAALEGGRLIDLYRFDPDKPKEAPSKWIAIGHMNASLVTFGLWEFVGMPIEQALKDRPLIYLLVYGSDGKLAEFDTAQEWRPASVAEAEREKCELLGALQAMRVSAPAAAENPLDQIRDSLSVDRERDDAYHRASLGCMLKHYARETEG